MEYRKAALMIDYTMITTDAELGRFRDYLRSSGITTLSMDFEGEFNLHIYGEKLCLIQVFDGKRFFAIDPFNISAGALALLLEDPKIVKLIYDANSDSKTIFKQYGIKLQSVYDQKLLVDVLDFEKKGLDAVLEKVLKVTVTQKGKFQRYNWTLRPIDKSAIEYALQDVEHLYRLNRELLALITAAGRQDELIRALVTRNIDYDKKSVPAIKKMQEYINLSVEKKMRFEKIMELREAAAKEVNCPPNDVLTKEQIFRLVSDRDAIASLRINSKIPARIRGDLLASLGSIET